jgi:hypothetical protein
VIDNNVNPVSDQTEREQGVHPLGEEIEEEGLHSGDTLYPQQQLSNPLPPLTSDESSPSSFYTQEAASGDFSSAYAFQPQVGTPPYMATSPRQALSEPPATPLPTRRRGQLVLRIVLLVLALMIILPATAFALFATGGLAPLMHQQATGTAPDTSHGSPYPHRCPTGAPDPHHFCAAYRHSGHDRDHSYPDG